MKLRVKADTKRVSRWLKRVFKDQIPFVTAQAINSTAFDVRKKIVEDTYKDAFDVKNTRFPSFATKPVKKANKKKLIASVGNLGKKVFDYLELHAEGGTKKPRGRHIAIPSRDLRDEFPDKIPKRQRPKAIMKKKGGIIFKTGKGIPIIAYRKPKRGKRGKAGDLEIKYILIKKAKIDKEFKFYEDARKKAVKVYERNWKKQFARAIRSAK